MIRAFNRSFRFADHRELEVVNATALVGSKARRKIGTYDQAGDVIFVYDSFKMRNHE
jgi:hypothetical protein